MDAVLGEVIVERWGNEAQLPDEGEKLVHSHGMPNK